jgi:VIT1/CCC1 family predicted Fe2+/Mn2+ transporter
MRAPTRPSLHREPSGPFDIARHYVRDLVYGANDGLITTFAVVAGVTGGDLSSRALLVVGVANLFADGLSMGVGNYLGIRSQEGVRAALDLPEEEAFPARHGLATLLAFVVAGAIPLAPFAWGHGGPAPLWASVGVTFGALFGIGALRSAITVDRWWRAGLEMLALGIAVALAAYLSGALIAGALGAG